MVELLVLLGVVALIAGSFYVLKVSGGKGSGNPHGDGYPIDEEPGDKRDRIV